MKMNCLALSKIEEEKKEERRKEEKVDLLLAKRENYREKRFIDEIVYNK